MTATHDHDPPPARPLAILDANGRPLWAALGGPGGHPLVYATIRKNPSHPLILDVAA